MFRVGELDGSYDTFPCYPDEVTAIAAAHARSALDAAVIGVYDCATEDGDYEGAIVALVVSGQLYRPVDA